MRVLAPTLGLLLALIAVGGIGLTIYLVYLARHAPHDPATMGFEVLIDYFVMVGPALIGVIVLGALAVCCTLYHVTPNPNR